MKAKYILVLILIFWVVIICLYGLLFREWVIQAYHGTAPDFFINLINGMYPRFAVEKHRFPLAFFLNKADQIFLRGSCMILMVLTAVFLVKRKIWQRLTEKQCSIQHAHILRLLFYAGLLYYTWDWIVDLQRLSQLQAFYKPVLIFKVIHLPLPGVWFFVIVYVIYMLSILGVIFRNKPVFAVMAAIIFTLMQGYFFSFEKIDHGYATLTYASLLMPFFLREVKQQNRERLIHTWSLPAIQTAIAGAYFFAGLEKVFTGGVSWATAHTFRTYLALHEVPLGLEVANNDFLSSLLPLLALLFQLGFPLILFFPKLRYIFLPGGIAFHTGTVLLFHIGAYFSPWIFVYIFFINWGWIADKLSAYAFTARCLNILKWAPHNNT